MSNLTLRLEANKINLQSVMFENVDYQEAKCRKLVNELSTFTGAMMAYDSVTARYSEDIAPDIEKAKRVATSDYDAKVKVLKHVLKTYCIHVEKCNLCMSEYIINAVLKALSREDKILIVEGGK